jgi:hypothetical protein
MSTSRSKETPVKFLDPEGTNVLWRLNTRAPDDAGYHYGADISELSQFQGEREVLFPPYTMLKVEDDTLDKLRDGRGEGGGEGSGKLRGSSSLDGFTSLPRRVLEQEVGGCRYLDINVTPFFV